MSDNDKPWECWIAYYHDYSGVAVFETEIEALGYAVENSMQVAQYFNGDDHPTEPGRPDARGRP